MRKIIAISVVLVLTAFAASAMSETGSAGMAGAFMKFGLGARSLGMGGAFCSVAEGIDAIYYNPGGLAIYPIRQVGFTYQSLTLDRHLNSASATFPVKNEAVLGLAWIHGSVGDVPMIDSDRNHYDDFSNSNNSFGLTFSKLFGEQFSVGGNIRYIQSTLDELNAYTVGVDLGALYRIMPGYTVGLTISDLGSNLKWDSSNYWSGSRGSDYTDKFPYRVRGGVSGVFLDEHLIASADIMKVERLDPKLYGGAEYWFMKKVSKFEEDEEAEDEMKEVIVNKRMFGLRTGYADGSLTFGMSLYYPIDQYTGGFDYAFMTGKQSEGSYHIFTVRVMF